MKHFDERDTMFSRLGLIRGTQKYRDYYEKHPDLQEEDDRVRESAHKTMARIFRMDPSQFKKKSERIAMIQRIISAFYDLTGRKMAIDPDRMLNIGSESQDDDGTWSSMVRPAILMANQIQLESDRRKPAAHRVKVNPSEMSNVLKSLAVAYGGDLAGIARLKSHHHYTNRGDMFGMGGGYGKPIHLSYTHAIVVAAALDQEMVNRAPRKETQIAAMLGYARSTAVSSQLAMYIKSLGYEARTDNFIEYYSPLAPLAAEAGLGQIGRCNMLVNPRYGNRLKMAAVLTSMPLAEDGPVDFGLVDFCRLCLRCARKCPAKAISFDDPRLINGLYQWRHDGAKCMEMWMTVGTGICMAACPFSQGIDQREIDRFKGHLELIRAFLSSFEKADGPS